MGNEPAATMVPAQLTVRLALRAPLHVATVRQFLQLVDALGIPEHAAILDDKDGSLICGTQGCPPKPVAVPEAASAAS